MTGADGAADTTEPRDRFGPQSVLQRRYDLVDDGVGLRAHLVVRRILDRMRHEDAPDFRKTQGGRLLFGRVHEHVGRDHHRGLAIDFKPYRVVHTARCARPSIGKRFDYEVALLRDLSAQLFGRRLGKRGLAIAANLDTRDALGKALRQPIHEHLAARLGDIEQGDPAGNPSASRGKRAPYRHTLIGGINDHLFHRVSSIRRLTLDEPIGPETHPAKIAENLPPSPPATMILIFSAERNFGILCSSCSGVGSLMPKALSGIPSPHSSSGRSSRSGRAVTSWIRLRTCALLHSSRAMVSACSGEMTSKTSPARCCFGCQHASSPRPSEATSARAVREV